MPDALPEPGALVLGANYRGLGVARSLGRRGVRVWVALSDEHRVAAASRYVERTTGWPRDEDEQVLRLRQLAHAHGLDGWTIFPTDDNTVALLARHADALAETYVLAAPSLEAVSVAYDKRETYHRGVQLDLPQPRTAFPRDHAAAAAYDGPFPAIIKPAVKATSNVLTDAKAWRVDDREELLAAYDDARAVVDPSIIMIQEVIPGGGASQLSFAALCRDGEVLASASAHRLRQRPMDFGSASTYVVTVEPDDAAQLARHLLRDLRYSGIVEVEFKRDPRDGQPKLLDINARAWGWHTLCARAGVDFPALYWDVLHGRDVPPITAAGGARWVRLTMDLPTGLGELLAGRTSVAAYLRSLRPPVEHATFARDDWRPAFVDAPLLAGLGARRAIRHRLSPGYGAHHALSAVRRPRATSAVGA